MRDAPPLTSLEPFEDVDNLWKLYQLQTSDECILLWYMVSVEHNAFLARYAHTTEETSPYKRHTEMRLHQMVIDGYRHEGGDPTTLRYIIIKSVGNLDVQRTMSEEAMRQTNGVTRATSANDVVTITPRSSHWEQFCAANPFMKSAYRLVQEIGRVTGQEILVRQCYWDARAKIIEIGPRESRSGKGRDNSLPV